MSRRGRAVRDTTRWWPSPSKRTGAPTECRFWTRAPTARVPQPLPVLPVAGVDTPEVDGDVQDHERDEKDQELNRASLTPSLVRSKITRDTYTDRP